MLELSTPTCPTQILAYYQHILAQSARAAATVSKNVFSIRVWQPTEQEIADFHTRSALMLRTRCAYLTGIATYFTGGTRPTCTLEHVLAAAFFDFKRAISMLETEPACAVHLTELRLLSEQDTSAMLHLLGMHLAWDLHHAVRDEVTHVESFMMGFAPAVYAH